MTKNSMWKTTLRNLAIPVVLTTIFALTLAIAGLYSAMALTLIVGALWIYIALTNMKTRNVLYEIRTLNRNVSKHTRSLVDDQLQIKTGESTSTPPEDDLLPRVERRLKRMNATLDNVAGSVGRTAPRIRNIDQAVQSLTQQQPLGASSSQATQRNTAQATKKTSTSTKKPSTLPPVIPMRAQPNFDDVRVVMVADEFTAKAFAYEWDVVEPTPSDWRETIDNHKPDFLFVESAWEANGGSWRYHIVGATAPRPALVEMVKYCQALGIRTIFWNKEDPPHFEDFLPTATLFDHVFTTDGKMIESYKQRLGHDRVELLAFAAQPKIHNPARVERLARSQPIVFGGMYFREKYPERRQQLDILLAGASKLGLDIFSRQSGSDIKYRFPDEFDTLVRGSLPYLQMLTAYHVYKVVINVNSVVDSATMCARRIFEATACGAAVVTTPTAAINNFFPGEMLTEVYDEKQAHNKMRALIRSAEYRERKVHVAQRHVWENHTYKHRAAQVLKDVGIHYNFSEKSVSFFITTNRPRNLRLIFENVGRQIVQHKQIVILTHGFTVNGDQIDKLSHEFDLHDVILLTAPTSDTLGKNLNRLTEACTGDLLCRMDDDDFYAPNYARDLLHALEFSGAALVGKAATYIHFESKDSTILSYEGHEHRFTDFVRGASFFAPKETFTRYQFPEVATSEDSAFLQQIIEAGQKIYAADRFNFMVMRRENKTSHTWTVSDDELYATGVMKFIGSDKSQIEV